MRGGGGMWVWVWAWVWTSFRESTSWLDLAEADQAVDALSDNTSKVPCIIMSLGQWLKNHRYDIMACCGIITTEKSRHEPCG